MANMLRGKFRDKLRQYFKNNKKSNDIKETKDTEIRSCNVSLKTNNEVKKDNNNIYKKSGVQLKKKKVGLETSLNKNRNNKKGIMVSPQINDSKVKDIAIEKKLNAKVNENKINLLEQKIVNKILEVVEEYKSELDVINSDIYIINLTFKEVKTKEQCEEEQKKIKILMEKINKIKDDFKVLKSKNLNNDYLEINDWSLVDLISYYKSILETIPNTKEIENSIKKMEIFEETNKILDKLNVEIKTLDKSNDEKLEKEKVNIEKFNQIKDNVFDFDNEYSRYMRFIKEQNNIIEELDQKVGNIEKTEQIKYKFVGYDKLFLNTLKYTSLLLLSPLKGAFPVIAISTLATKNSIELLSKEAHVEKTKKINFNVEDFSNTISSNISSIDIMGSMIESSLNDIKVIKNKLHLISPNSISLEYSNLMNRLNDFEEILKGNKSKINKLREKMNKNLIINKNAIIKVKKLNEHC